MSSPILPVVDLVYDTIENNILKDDEHPLQRSLLIVSVIAIPVIVIIWGNEIFARLHLSFLFSVIYDLAVIWAPFMLLEIFMHSWMGYIRADYIAKEGSVLLEVHLPKETYKSPLAMEIFFTSLYQTGTATYIETYWKGKIRPWFSFEMVSIDGQVKFFIWVQPKYRNLVESQLYAQYPTIEIHEAADYSLAVPHDPETMPIWGTYFKLTDPDVYPIKTYVDYGLDKDPKEEFKIDPMTSVLEFLGSMRKGEQVWIQIIIQCHKKVGLKDGYLFPKPDWKGEALEEIKKIRKEATPETTGDSNYPGMPLLTKGQQEKIASLERSIGKFPFECCIRGFYIAKQEAFDKSRFSGLIGSFRQYSSNYSNGFKLGKFTDYDYPWQDFRRIRRNRIEACMLDAYKRRSFFQYPYKYYRQTPFILMTEELATIYHFPGSAVQTPSMERIPSKRVEPPANLPI